MVGDGSYPGTHLDGQAAGSVLTSDRDCALIGLRVTNGSALAGGGIHITNARIRLTNCILMGNTADHGGALALENAQGWLQNCTIYENVGRLSSPAISISGLSSRLSLDASIVWNPPSSAGASAQIGTNDLSNVQASRSDIRGGFEGAGNFDSDPLLNVFGRIIVYSPCINAFATNPQSPVRDLDNEPRNDEFSDIGADEYVDANNDFLPDAWTAVYSISLGRWDDDADEDLRINLDEYRYGSDPTKPQLIKPSNLDVQLINQNQANIQWDFVQPANDTLWCIERKLDTGDYAQVASQTNSANWIDTSLLPGHTYSYRIRIFSEDEMSAYSNEIIVSVPATLDISGIPWADARLWMTADTIARSGNITRWTNRKNAGEFAEQFYDYWQPSLIASGIRNRPAVHFDGTSSHLLLPDLFSAQTEGEIFVVHKTGTPASNTYYGFLRLGNAPYDSDDSDAARGWSWYPTDSGRIFDGFGSTVTHDTGTPVTSITEAHVYNALSSSSEWSSRLNGITQFSTSTNTVGFTTTPAIGYSAWFYQGDIAEILLFSRTLTSGERDAVNSYLSARYNIRQVVTDRDGDDLIDSRERELGTDPLNADTDGDGRQDGWEVRYGYNPLVNDALSDTDEDGMTDDEEIQFGFNFFQPSDAFEDADGDGFPNVVEIRRLTHPKDAMSFPAPDLIVSPVADDQVHPVQEAVDALAVQGLDYGIVRLENGVYPENLHITARSIIFVGSGAYPGVCLDGQMAHHVVKAEKDCAFIGIRFKNGNASTGGGFLLKDARARLTNCILQSNRADHGGAVALENAAAWLQNCTLYENIGNIDCPGVSVSATSQLWVDCSIVWNPQNANTANVQITQSTSLVVVSFSDVLGGHNGHNNFSTEPLLNPDGRIILESTCVNTFPTSTSSPAFDIDQEMRGDGFIDVGADEYVDADQSFLPDAWVNIYPPNNLGPWDSDPDNDLLKNLDEYKNGTNALDNDTDSDGLSDGFEVNSEPNVSGQARRLNPRSSDSNYDGIPDNLEDFDGDGLSNLMESELGTKPFSADTDEDGVNDNEDGWALVPGFAPPKLPKRLYKVVPIGPEKSAIRFLNHKGEAIYAVDEVHGNDKFYRWKDGVSTLLPETIRTIKGFSDTGLYIGTSDPGIDFVATVGGELLPLAKTLENPDPSTPFNEAYAMCVFNSGVVAGWEGYSIGFNNIVEGCHNDVYRTSFWDGAGLFLGAGVSIGNVNAWDHTVSDDSLSSNAHLYYSLPTERVTNTSVVEYHANGLVGATYPNINYFFANGGTSESFNTTNGRIALGERRSVSGDKREFHCSYYNANDELSHLDIFEGTDSHVGVWWNGSSHAIDFSNEFAGASISTQNHIVAYDENNQRAIWLDESAGIRNDVVATNNPVYRKIVWQPSFGDLFPPLNARMEGIGWRNGKAFDFSKEVPELLAPNGSWSQFQPISTLYQTTAINDQGVIGGTAVRTKRPDGTAIPVNMQKPQAVLLMPINVELVPDYDRDGEIDDADRRQVGQNKPFRWWLNDDDDAGDLSNEDTPLGVGNTRADSALGNSHVDGVGDLVDLFPLFLDIKKLLELLPPIQYSYRLKQDDASLNFTYTDLMPPEAGKYLRDSVKTNSLKAAQTFTIFANGSVALNDDFLNEIENNGAGIILLEGGNISNKPLYLQVFKGNEKVFEVPFYVNIASVEKMYRWVNLRSVAGQSAVNATDTSIPSNYPDDETNGKMFILVHGYNVSERQSRGWFSETFKRIFQSGSKSMYTGVSWHGDSSQIGSVSPDYWENVTHAFESSPFLAATVTDLPGTRKIVAAHSLGNMVVSSAIMDHGLKIDGYFMLDAAVAMEAYDSSVNNTVMMRNPDWHPNSGLYDFRLWASKWHELFDEDDERRHLTWKNRFEGIALTYNFYSTGEEVLNNSEGRINFPSAERAWARQEMTKGTNDVQAVITLDSQGGWGFNPAWNVLADSGRSLRNRLPSETTEITAAELKIQPFFNRFQDIRLMDENQGSAAAGEYLTRAKTLGDAIPALSFAAGRNAIGAFIYPGEDRNYDLMNLKNREGAWPAERLSDAAKATRWLHGDAKDVAFRFNYVLYEKWVELGSLK